MCSDGYTHKFGKIVYIVIYLCYCMKTDRICGMHGGNNGGKFAVNENCRNDESDRNSKF